MDGRPVRHTDPRSSLCLTLLIRWYVEPIPPCLGGEAFYVVSGEYAIFVEDDEHICGAGSFIYIPPGVIHGFRVGPAPSRKLNIYVPAAMTGYFDELADAHRLNTPLAATGLGELADRYGMQVI